MPLPDDSRNHNEICLQWTDLQLSVHHEELVAVLDVNETEVVLSTKTPFNPSTGVSLVVGDDSVPGTVIACRPDQENFIVIIRLVPSIDFPEKAQRDPGILAVDDFLTEEQEQLLLDEIEKEWRDASTGSRAATN